MPVGPETLGRILNVIGEPVDEAGDVGAKKTLPIHRAAPEFTDQEVEVQMFETGPGDFDEEPTAEMLAELENEMEMNGAFADNSSPDFTGMTVAQLKQECKSRGLKVSGKKAELIERLQESG